MLVNSILFIFLILFSLGLFFINNLYIIISLVIISIVLSLIFKVRLPIKIPFIIILIISFTLNYLLLSIDEAILVTTRLITMFIQHMYLMGNRGRWKHLYSISTRTQQAQ